MKVNQLLIGLGLQVGALLIGYASNRVLSYVSWLGWWLISLPMYAASTFYLMRCGLPLAVRVILSFWAPASVAAMVLYAAASHAIEMRKIRTEVFLVPAGYRGLVTVFFNEPNGAAAENDGDKVVFRIGTNGELRSRVQEPKFSSEGLEHDRHKRREYYAVDRAGVKVRLECPDPYDSSKIPEDRVVVFPMGWHFKEDRILKVEFVAGTTGDISNYLNSR